MHSAESSTVLGEIHTNAGSMRFSPMIAAMPPGPAPGTSRIGVGRDRGFGRPSQDHQHRRMNPGSPSPTRYDATVELYRMIRHARLTHGGSPGSSSSSSGTWTPHNLRNTLSGRITRVFRDTSLSMTDRTMDLSMVLDILSIVCKVRNIGAGLAGKELPAVYRASMV